MNGENFNRTSVKLRVLVAPLDWGLGHATRCIPIIKELIANGLDVIVAASGRSEILLRTEFPELRFLFLRGYNISFSKKKIGLFLKIIRQLPGIKNTIAYEHMWLNNCIKEHGIDIVISDNRPGLYHESVKTIYITHQLNIKTGNPFSSWIANRIHYRYINKFSECWVPDAAEEINLAAILSHPYSLPKIPVKYLGPLSRFEKKNNLPKKYDLMILLSGPEPQRSLLEEKIVEQLKNYTAKKIILVRGLPGNSEMQPFSNATIQQYNHLAAEELNTLIQQSQLVIARSGYTTIMDLVKLQQKAVLVPTPGQSEQEYLADYLMEKKIFYSVQQQNFVLDKILNAVNQFSFYNIEIEEKYKTVIKKYLETL
ncbi:MAG: glycosyltransferase [Ferruginibacter sp.]